MTTIAVVSMKGGVGKTSVTTSLAFALAKRLGDSMVTVVDLDPQNAACWHLGLGGNAGEGICEQSAKDLPWIDAALESRWGIRCFPYGAVSEETRRAMEFRLGSNPEWLADQLDSIATEGGVTLIDTPPGASPYLSQALRVADFVLVVLLPDGGSYATVASMDAQLREIASAYPEFAYGYVINQLDLSEPLAADVSVVLRKQLGKRLAPVSIHIDEAVKEALAFQRPVLDYDPHGQASHDIDKLARWLLRSLDA